MQINAGAMFPIIATQFGINRAIVGIIEPNRPNGLSNTDRIAMGMVAGTASSVFGCPAEYLMNHQQKTGNSLLEAFKTNTSKFGLTTVYRGWVCNVFVD